MGKLGRMLMMLAPALAAVAQAGAPKVVQTVPANGDQAVRPGLQPIRIVFDQDMSAGGHALCTVEDAPFPDIAGEARWADKRTFVATVRLKPGTEYGMNINSPNYMSFKNPAGEAAEVYTLKFKTAASAAPVSTAGKSPASLLQQGRYAEETEGDLDKAIDLYEQALERADRIERIAAEATFQLGMCYLKKGDKDAARRYFERVQKDFATQTASVDKAQKQLKEMRPQKVDSVFEQVSYQVLTFVAEKYGQLAAEAGAKSIFCNAHLHAVDKEFACYSGGLGYHYNWTGHSLTGKVRLSGTSFPDQTLYDTTGQKLDIEIVPDKDRKNFYHIYWIPKEPLKPQEAIYYGWSRNKRAALARLPGGDGAMLTMQNHYGPKVLETFFLALPAGVEIAGDAKPTDTRDFGDYKVSWWTREVPDDTNHLVNVIVRTGARITDAKAAATTVGEVVMTISTCAEGDPRVEQALKKLGSLDQNIALSEVAKFLDSEQATVRRSAIYVCWRGGFDDIAPAEDKLIKLCSHAEIFTRGMAALALGTPKATKSYEALVNMTLNDADGYARRCAAYALGTYGDAKALEVLEKALKDKDSLVQHNAQTAIEMLKAQKDK